MGANTPRRSPSIPGPKSRSLTAPPGFFFTTNDRRRACRSKLTIEYARAPTMPGTVSSANWPAAKSMRLIEIHVEREHVVGERPAAPHDAGERPRRRRASPP